MFFPVVVLFVAAESSVLRYISDPFDVDDALHRRAIRRNGHEVVALSDCGTGALTATETSAAATTTALRLLTGRSLGRTKVDLA